MGTLSQISLAGPGPLIPQVGARQQTPPGVAAAVAATTKAVPEVRKDAFVFAPAAAQAAAVASMQDASFAEDQEAEVARDLAGTGGRPASSVLPEPRRDINDPAVRIIPEPKPLVGPAPARVAILGFDPGTDPVLEETRRSAQAEQAYRATRAPGPEASASLGDRADPGPRPV